MTGIKGPSVHHHHHQPDLFTQGMLGSWDYTSDAKVALLSALTSLAFFFMTTLITHRAAAHWNFFFTLYYAISIDCFV